MKLILFRLTGICERDKENKLGSRLISLVWRLKRSILVSWLFWYIRALCIWGYWKVAKCFRWWIGRGGLFSVMKPLWCSICMHALPMWEKSGKFLGRIKGEGVLLQHLTFFTAEVSSRRPLNEWDVFFKRGRNLRGWKSPIKLFFVEN